METTNRFIRTLLCQPVDRVPDIEFGFWDQTIRRWKREGLPEGLPDAFFHWQLNEHFDMDSWPTMAILCHMGMNPTFKEEVLEEDDRVAVMRTSDGVVARRFKGGTDESSIPQFISYPVTDMDSFKRMRDERYRLDDPVRKTDPKYWDEVRRKVRNPDCVTTFWAGSLYGWARGWMGMENLAIAFHEQPKLVEAMMDMVVELALHGLRQVPADIPIHYTSWWEDMCFKTGPLISPRMFRDFMVPRYQRVMREVAKHGCQLAQVDCDGNIHQLIGLWLEAGVNVMMPIEIGGGTDPFRIRKEFGKAVRMTGGVDKKAIAKGERAINAELDRLAPLVADGGFIPHMDHLVPPDISLHHYWYYRQQKHKMLDQVKPAV